MDERVIANLTGRGCPGERACVRIQRHARRRCFGKRKGDGIDRQIRIRGDKRQLQCLTHSHRAVADWLNHGRQRSAR